MAGLKQLLRKQMRIEKSHSKALKPSLKKASNPLVRTLLESIMHDSMKHAAICRALLKVDYLDKSSMDLDMGSAVELHQDIKQHIRVEDEMLKHIEGMVDKTKDARIKAILDHMLEDEKRHHSTLVTLSNLIDQDTTTFDEYLGLFQKFMVVPN